MFASAVGTEQDPHNVRVRQFRRGVQSALAWTRDLDTWELRHSFVSILSDHGARLQDISDMVGHSGTSVTESVYRQQIRPAITAGAEAMDEIFSTDAG